MGTTQNPNPYQNRAQSTDTNNPSPSQNPNPVTPQVPKVPSFEEVSVLFSVPLSDAAESLGVSSSVLKTVCYENGLVRWPYRKFVAGKSIEEIKNEAAIEKEGKFLAPIVSGKKCDSMPSLAVSSPTRPQSTNTGLRTSVQQREGSQSIHGTNMSRGNSAAFDEFKYGFPSQGLSNVSYKWWGDKDDDQQCVKEETIITELTSGDSKSLSDGSKIEKEAETECTSLLRSSREKAARDCDKALKLGVHRGYNAKALDKQKQMVLLQIFQSSLPVEWSDS